MVGRYRVSWRALRMAEVVPRWCVWACDLGTMSEKQAWVPARMILGEKSTSRCASNTSRQEKKGQGVCVQLSFAVPWP